MASFITESLIYDNEKPEFSNVYWLQFASANTDWTGTLVQLTIDGQRTLTISQNAWLFIASNSGNRMPMCAGDVKVGNQVYIGVPCDKVSYPTLADEQLWDMGCNFAVMDDVVPVDVLQCPAENISTFINGFAATASPVRTNAYQFTSLRAAQFFSMAATKARGVYAAMNETTRRVTLPQVNMDDNTPPTATVIATQHVQVDANTSTWVLHSTGEDIIANGFLVNID